MKYLLIGYTGIAIPLDMLVRAGDIKMIGTEYDEVKKKMLFFDKGSLDSHQSSYIIDEKDIRPYKPEGDET